MQLLLHWIMYWGLCIGLFDWIDYVYHLQQNFISGFLEVSKKDEVIFKNSAPQEFVP